MSTKNESKQNGNNKSQNFVFQDNYFFKETNVKSVRLS